VSICDESPLTAAQSWRAALSSISLQSFCMRRAPAEDAAPLAAWAALACRRDGHGGNPATVQK